VFIGHSQGASILIKLLKEQVDAKPSMRHRLVSALLLGGNLTVGKGRTTGGDFKHIPLCSSSTQTGCVVAYSSFTTKPPPNSQFGRTSSDAGVSLLAPHNISSDIAIACVNPAAPAGGQARLDPYVPSLFLQFLPAGGAPQVRTAWVSFPAEYTASCKTSGNATWLQVTHTSGSLDHRPLLGQLVDPTLGLHILDVNIALGNLVQLVRDGGTVWFEASSSGLAAAGSIPGLARWVTAMSSRLVFLRRRASQPVRTGVRRGGEAAPAVPSSS
jgi:hypothetical protein